MINARRHRGLAGAAPVPRAIAHPPVPALALLLHMGWTP